MRTAIVLFFLGAAVRAERATLPEAQAQLRRQQFAEAAASLEDVTRREPGNAAAWFLYGYAVHACGRYDEAVPLHERAATFPKAAPAALFNLACAHARLGDAAAAVAALRRAAQAGRAPQPADRWDPDLRSLRGDPRFDAVVPPGLDDAPAPAGDDRQFDFWLGEWQTRNRVLGPNGLWRDGQQLTIKVTKVLGGKAVLEFAESKDGSKRTLGFSLRTYDAATGRWLLLLNWPQPDQPRFHVMRGYFRHGRAEFFSASPAASGFSWQRYTFSDIATDRFRWDQAVSKDAGRTWSTTLLFEGTRRPADAPPLSNGPSTSNRYGTRPECRAFDFTLGRWRGERRDAAGRSTRVAMEVESVLEGGMLLERVDAGDRSSIAVRSFVPARKAWTEYRLEDPAAGFVNFRGGPARMAGVGGPPHLRVTWERGDPGRLTRTEEESRDGGATWALRLRDDLAREP